VAVRGLGARAWKIFFQPRLQRLYPLLALVMLVFQCRG
jgi:hypothetical protein